MTIKKWFFSVAYIICLLISFSCKAPSASHLSSEDWMDDNGKLKVLSTTTMVEDLVKEIGGEWVDSLALINGEIDPHSYELVKGDDEKIFFAKIIFYNGLNLEHGASLRYLIEKHPWSIALGDEIEKRHSQEILFVGRERDPHIWMDVSLWMKAIEPIAENLSKADPEHASYFQKNAESLRQKMRATHQRISSLLQNTPSQKRFLVTSHDAFNYFARRYLAEPEEVKDAGWKKRFAAPEGLAPDGQLSADDIQKIIDHLNSHRIEVVFPESNVSRDSLKKIVSAGQELGLKVRLSPEVLYGDALGSSDSGADTYLKMMEHNSQTIYKEWQ